MAEYPPHGLHDYDDELKLYIDAGDWNLLTGDDPPEDVVFDPPTSGDWTYSYESGSWFGPAYEVSWQAGDNVGEVPVIPGAGSGAVQTSILVGAGPKASDQPTEGIPQYDWPGDGDGTVTTASVTGSGIIFLIMQEEGLDPGPTVPPQPDLDVLDYLGDLVLTNGTNVIPWALDPGTGADDDFYLWKVRRTLFGPRTEGQWGSGTRLSDPVDALEVSAASDVPILTGYAQPDGVADLTVLYNGDNDPAFRVTQSGDIHALGGVVLTSPDATAYRLVVANDGTLSTVAV